MEPVFAIGMFLFGLVFGSFLNVCIYRLPQGLSIVLPGSACPGCNKPIRPYVNIPVLSWVLLRGRCRDCKARISPRYMIVELLTGVLFLACFAQFGIGESAKTVTIPIIDDAFLEGNETFGVAISNGLGANLGSQTTATVTITDNDVANGSNPLSNNSFFVRQQYLDFLNREPDASGLAFWTNQTTNCGAAGSSLGSPSFAPPSTQAVMVSI